MKFFISHKKEDESIALKIAHELLILRIPYYLDALDSSIVKNGKELTDHIKNKLNDCTEILVVISDKTKYSQWVPFEVGMAAQRDFPTATFLQKDIQLPEFLEYWPRLKNTNDLIEYVTTRIRVDREYSSLYHMDHNSATRSKTDYFYSELKAKLK